MRRGDHFVELYNDLNKYILKKTQLSNKDSFSKLLKTASSSDPSIRRRMAFLQKMGELRNAIVHHEKYPAELIADPLQETIDEFQKTVHEIKNPTKIYPTFKKRIDFFSKDKKLIDALQYMQKNDYSQVVVHIYKEYRLISSEGIVRWLSSACEIGLADIENTSLELVYQYEEPKEYLKLGRNETIDYVLVEFEKAIAKNKPRLQAVLITDNGKPTEKPLGIITPWDLVHYASKNELA